MNEQMQQLLQYIQDNLRQGHSEQAIRDLLHQHNWDINLVNQAFATIKNTHESPVTAQSHSPLGDHYTTTSQSPLMSQTSTSPVDNSAYPAVDKYKVLSSMGDAFRAIRTNIGSYLVSLLLTMLLMGLTSVAMLVALLGTMFASYGASSYGSDSNLLNSMAFFVILILVFYLLVYPAITTIAFNSTSLALYRGNIGVKNKLGTVIKTTFSKFGRVFMSVILVALTLYLPLIALVIMSAFSKFGDSGSGTEQNIILLLGGIAGIIWVIVGLLRFALAPFVALFEPEVPIMKTLSRSKHLLVHGGQWFLVKWVVVLVIINILWSFVAAILTSSGGSSFSIANSIVSFVGSMFLDAVLYASLLMLYQNRRAVRG